MIINIDLYIVCFSSVLKTAPSVPELDFPSNNSVNVSFAERDTLVFSCSSYSYPPPSLVWKRGNTVLVNSSRITITDMSLPFENNSTKVNSMLSIQDLLPNDEGTYECVASNEEDATRSTINVYVQGG